MGKAVSGAGRGFFAQQPQQSSLAIVKELPDL
jgi:hypothetical protein